MSKEFKSEFFKTVDDLLAIKAVMESDQSKRRARLRVVRQFSNGLATLSKEDAEALGATEITNHLTTYKFLLGRSRRLQQTFTSTRTFVEIKVDTDNPEWDHLTSLRMTQAFNRGLVYHLDGQIRNFVKALAGETQIAGGVPVGRCRLGGWAPKIALNMLIPKKSEMVVSELKYAMAPEELSLTDLEALRDSIKGEGDNVSKKPEEMLITALKKKPKGEGTTGSSIDTHQQVERPGSVVDEENSNRNAAADVWWYFEVKTRKNGTQYVSGTVFTQEIQNAGDGQKTGPQVIAYYDELFKSPEDWLHLFSMGMEIGGDTTWDSVRGVAEIMFPSATEIETLLNLILEGDKERAKPKYQVASNAAADAILGWDPDNDSVVPAGIQSFDMKGSSAPLLTPFQLLMGNVAGLGSGEVANTRQGGELRQQAVGRQRENTVMQFGDMADWTQQLEGVFTPSVERAFVGEISPKARGYHQTMWLRDCMQKYKVPLKKLFTREHGQLKYVSIRVRRILGDGGVDSENSASDFLMSIYQKLAPQKRPRVLKIAIADRTQDPDLAESLVSDPTPIINAQKLTAENECDTIMRRALLGEAITTNADDIDMDHIPVHLKDLIALLSRHQLEPWTKLDVIRFAGLQRHTQDHFENVMGDKDVRDEALALLPQFQQIVQAAEAIVAGVEEREGQPDDGMTPKERAELQLKVMAEQRKGMELGVKMEGNTGLERQRLARMAQVSRSQYVRELTDAARLSLERRKTEAAIAKTEAETRMIANPPPETS